MSDKVAQWLDGLGLSRYTAAFTENEVGFPMLTELSDAGSDQWRQYFTSELKRVSINATAIRSKLSDCFIPQQPFEAPEIFLSNGL